mmetsp:Transcript_15713/g.46371  ORF Transcript_15713/g.46371 Transcript_15713/m.46371 type:complete len:222 (-) Transcript_15713:1233-1898(-)
MSVPFWRMSSAVPVGVPGSSSDSADSATNSALSSFTSVLPMRRRAFSALSSMTLRTSAVSTNSGHTQCSATLYGGRASTTAWLRTKLSTPALLAAYAGAAGIGKKAPAEATARMVPPRPFIAAAAACVPVITAVKLTSTVRCQTSFLSSSTTPCSAMPALRHATSSPPNASTCAANAAACAVASVTSSRAVRTATPSPCLRRSSAATSSRPGACRSSSVSA